MLIAILLYARGGPQICGILSELRPVLCLINLNWLNWDNRLPRYMTHA